jgi:hypothetical protein
MTQLAASQRERFVALKEGSGNVAFALFLSSHSFINKFRDNYLLILLLIILSSILYWSHIVHRSRQAYYEIDLLGLTNSDKNYQGKNLKKYIGKRL